MEAAAPFAAGARAERLVFHDERTSVSPPCLPFVGFVSTSRTVTPLIFRGGPMLASGCFHHR
jgi:hypothetical protein